MSIHLLTHLSNFFRTHAPSLFPSFFPLGGSTLTTPSSGGGGVSLLDLDDIFGGASTTTTTTTPGTSLPIPGGSSQGGQGGFGTSSSQSVDLLADIFSNNNRCVYILTLVHHLKRSIFNILPPPPLPSISF